MAGQAAMKTRKEVVADIKKVEHCDERGATGGEPHGHDHYNAHGTKHDGSGMSKHKKGSY